MALVLDIIMVSLCTARIIVFAVKQHCFCFFSHCEHLLFDMLIHRLPYNSLIRVGFDKSVAEKSSRREDVWLS
jgi:hypothetical protein